MLFMDAVLFLLVTLAAAAFRVMAVPAGNSGDARLRWSCSLFVLILSAVWPDASGGQASANRHGEVRPLRVVTYNLLHDGPGSGFLIGDTQLEERLEVAIRELKRLDPDIVAVQEASESRRHGHVPDRLARALGCHVVFAPATEHLFGAGVLARFVVGVLGFKEGSAILSRFPIVASEIYELPRCTSGSTGGFCCGPISRHHGDCCRSP